MILQYGSHVLVMTPAATRTRRFAGRMLTWTMLNSSDFTDENRGEGRVIVLLL